MLCQVSLEVWIHTTFVNELLAAAFNTPKNEDRIFPEFLKAMNGTMSQLNPRNINVCLKSLSFNINPQSSFSIMSYDIILDPVCQVLSNALITIPTVPVLCLQICSSYPNLYSRVMKNIAMGKCKNVIFLNSTLQIKGIFQNKIQIQWFFSKIPYILDSSGLFLQM